MERTAPQSRYLSFVDFLALEQSSETKHEYIGGEVHAMVGASRSHNIIAMNLSAHLFNHLRGTPCRPFMSDMLLHMNIAQEDIGYYPDLMVACRPDDNHPRYLEQPTIIVEILSDSTRRTDLREKFLAYQTLESVQEYLIVEQDRQHLSLFRRENHWKAEYFGKE